MSSRFASLHSGLLIRDRAPAPPPVLLPHAAALAAPLSAAQPEPQRTAIIRPFPFPPVAAPAPQPVPQPQAPAATPQAEAKPRRRSFTLRLDEGQHLLLQIAKRRFGLSGQRVLLKALEALLGKGG